MINRGHVKNGAIILDEDVSLPDGTAVDVQPVEEAPRTTRAVRFKDVIGKATNLAKDMAKNHDHYLYGTPKNP